MGTSFNEKFDQHGVWRREFALRLKLMAQWLKDQDLLDASVEDRLQRLQAQVRADKVMVAFVAEFSRGKSELINAIFFAGYGRRIMPASAGRTTMCPTEMGFDPEIPPCLRLLPIETRLKPQSLMEWRMAPEKWERTDLEVNNPKQLAEAFSKVAETRRVTLEEAHALGFWQRQSSEQSLLQDAQGMVDIPKWRHALINIAHPLLKQGLVILDTPGLNAIGAEPELTVSLIPQAQAVVFILGADTGVTQSDLSIWQEHLVEDEQDVASRLVVLNKIDTLWDALDSTEEIEAQIERQRRNSANILRIPEKQVVAVSAQKGLIAKVTQDDELLKRSCLADLEDALSRDIMGRRQKILGAAVARSVSALRAETARFVQIRRRDLVEQLLELKGLQGKNSPVIRNMRSRVAQEQADFDAAGVKIHAVRSVHLKLMREIFALLGSVALKGEMAQLSAALKQKGFKVGIKRLYGDTFERLRANLQQVHVKGMEIHAMLAAMFLQLNTEYGFSLQVPAEPLIDPYLADLNLIERSHVQYLGLGNAFRLAQPEFADRLVRALSNRLRNVNETVLSDIEAWSKSAAAQLDLQLRERRKNFVRRLEAIDRIADASNGLDERIAEVNLRSAEVDQVELKLVELTDSLMQMTKPERFGLALDEQ
ncbi:MAG: dynamin family protein [Rhodoferax sp.]|nr:dynamin family protein [Rhodoferax sp.]OIP19751.1 MAG: dynamin family protein [Comamonadaceae bacterium CG2_30_60_41]PIW07358.1 MAG: dynamin family protein [Comamonadaceae bacterium CG17_big_fil_post_rev_8_21_14_2_50_60_13]PIY26329.1 MAG: dynamin family protein [Comamonadaceae bacterium CG_4_10_14_3_um_filter_60_75]PJC12553.1 MAG: dynamin family protein [Comamonadaceae bacterium CG_4_9_14_0_8_um_filter_60_18]